MKQTSTVIYLKSIIIDIVSFFVKRNWLRLSPFVWSDVHQAYVDSLRPKPRNTVKKVVFFIHDTISLDHMYPIMQAMPEESFDIILTNFKSSFTLNGLLHIFGFKKEKDFFWNKKKFSAELDYLKVEKKCRIYLINDTYGQKKHSLVVSAHNGLESSSRMYRKSQVLKHSLKSIGDYSAYCQFTIDIAFSKDYERNRHFDLIFYPGPWNQSQCKSTDLSNSLSTFCVGVPRLEGFFEKQKVQKDVNAKTILWLPTHTPLSSLKYFLPLMNSIGENYRLILRPHPYCFDEISRLTQKINLNTNIILDTNTSAQELLSLSDYVFCDYGGSVFTAIYCDKNVVLLNCPFKDMIHKLGFFKSPEFLLRSEIINFNVGEEDKILAALKDEAVWEKQKPIRAAIKKQFFTVDEEPASKKIVRILMEQLEKNAS